MPSLRLAVMTGLWRRPALSALMLREARPLFDLALAVGSEGPMSEKLAVDADFDYVEAANKPLSNKFNGGLEALRGRCDAVMFLGSDDFVSIKAVEAAREAMESCPFFGYLDIHFLTYGPRAMYLPSYAGEHAGKTVGAGRTLSAALLDAVDWRPWPPGLPRGLDSGMMRVLAPHFERLGPPKAVRATKIGAAMMDVKTSESLSLYAHLQRRCLATDPSALLAHFSPSLRDDMLRLLENPPPPPKVAVFRPAVRPLLRKPPRPVPIRPPAPRPSRLRRPPHR